QHFAQRRAVVAADPLPERQEFLIEHGLSVEQPQHLPRLHLRRVVMAAQDHAGQLPWTKRNQDAAAGRYPMTQRLRQRVREGLIERDGKTYVTKKGCRMSDFGFRWCCLHSAAPSFFAALSSSLPKPAPAPRRSALFPSSAARRRPHPDDAASTRNP